MSVSAPERGYHWKSLGSDAEKFLTRGIAASLAEREGMTLDAMLCDFATVREGLLHVLGGGINRLWREKFPANMGSTLALLLEIHPTEADMQHTMAIFLINEDGRRLAEVNADFQVGRNAAASRPGENILMPLAVSLQQMTIPAPGAYSVEILLDGQHKRSLGVLAASPSADDRRRKGRTGGGGHNN